MFGLIFLELVSSETNTTIFDTEEKDVAFVYSLTVAVFLIPFIITYIYVCVKKLRVLKTQSKCYFIFQTFVSIIGPVSLAVVISSIYCLVKHFHTTKGTYELLIYMFGVAYVLCLIFNLVTTLSVDLSGWLPYYHFIGAKFYSLSELTEKIAEVRTSPPIFQINQRIYNGPTSLYKYIEYKSWEETEKTVVIPRNSPLCVSFEILPIWSEDMKNEYYSIKAKNSGISSQRYVNVDAQPLIVGNQIPSIVRIMTKPFMKVIFWIFTILPFTNLLDIIFFSTCREIKVKCSKKADFENIYRAKAGEKDIEAETSVFKESKNNKNDLL